MLVYVIINNITGRKYVGQTSKDLNIRWEEHTRIRSRPFCSYLYNAICKYGSENFIIQPLVIIGTKWEANLYEQGLIKAFGTKAPNGYNLTEGGDGGTGYVFTDEQRRKVSEGQKGHKISEKTREKLLERNKGNTFSLGSKMSEEHRLKLININTGSKMTGEARHKMSEAHKGKKHTEETKRKMSEAAKRRYSKEASNVLESKL